MKIIRHGIKPDNKIFECICFCETNIVISSLAQTEKIKNCYYVICPRCGYKYLLKQKEKL